MSSILIKKQQFKKQLEDTFKEHQEFIKYSKNVLLLNRPIDFGVLLLLVSLILYYFKGFNISAVSFFSFFISFILILHTIIINSNLKFISRVIPIQDPKDSYDDIINLIVKIKFAFSDSLSELNRFRHVNPTKFNIQASIFLIILGSIGIFLSGFTIITILVYTILGLPYVLYGKKPQNTGQASQDILNNVIVVMKPIVENLIVMAQNLYTFALDKATNKKQPSPGIPNQTYSSNSNNSNSNNNSNNDDITNTINKNINNIGNSINNNVNNIGSNVSNRLSQQYNQVQQQAYQQAQQAQQQQQPTEYSDYSDESTFTKNNSGYSNPSNPVLKKRY